MQLGITSKNRKAASKKWLEYATDPAISHPYGELQGADEPPSKLPDGSACELTLFETSCVIMSGRRNPQNETMGLQLFAKLIVATQLLRF